ncbi:MAG: hypothetical protein D6819_06595, partial [Gammaproteobacteria bacterium]
MNALRTFLTLLLAPLVLSACLEGGGGESVKVPKDILFAVTRGIISSSGPDIPTGKLYAFRIDNEGMRPIEGYPKDLGGDRLAYDAQTGRLLISQRNLLYAFKVEPDGNLTALP